MSKKVSFLMILLMVFSLMNPSFIQLSKKTNTDNSNVKAAEKSVQLEDLGRGLVAVDTEEGIFLSWRLLAQEVSGYSDFGMRGTDFNIYRNGDMIDTVTTSTNYTDADGEADDSYYVVPVVDGEEQSNASKEVTSWENGYYDLPLQKPEDGVTPAGESYTYHANDVSVGDVTGDGQYEYMVKWEPSNSKDVSQVGYTGNTYIDTYTISGELLYRIDLGVNIRSGAHYTQFLVYDFDGSGKAELMFKTAPGTKVITYEDNQPVEENYITMPEADKEAGYSHDDDYRMNADDYYQHLVDMFENWHEHEEVLAGNWPETIEEALGAEELSYDYPLSNEDAQELADYFIDVYAPSKSERNDLRAFEGFVLTGPEYVTVFNGETGAELDTVEYKPGRHHDGLMWGDYAMSRIEPGNRVDRFLAGVAYLNGETPSAIFARGYYTRSTLVAYDFNGNSIEEKWFVDSGWTPMSNPFNDGPHGTPGTNEEFSSLTTQGNHQLSTADVDGDGNQEIIYGAATIDHDGSLLYSSSDTMPEGSGNPGAEAGLGHGDALHVADIDPDREGLEIFSVFEGGAWAPYGFALRDAATGEVLHGEYTGNDTGRGMIGDVIRGQRGMEVWATDLRSADGEILQSSGPGTNMNIKWSADMATQIVNGSGDNDVTIDDFENGRMLTAEGTRTNNGTKGNPSLVADIFGDWREELVVRTTNSNALRIFTNTEETNRKLHTLMHDIQYRTGVAWQNVSYNQPAYPSFYMSSDIDWDKVSVPNKGELDYVEEEPPEIDTSSLAELLEEAKTITNENGTYTENSYHVLQDAISESEIAIEEIQFDHELNAAIQQLQSVIDQLEEIVDLGPGYLFDFGSESSPVANGYLQVSDQTAYEESNGYGFTNGTDGARDQDGSELTRDFILSHQKEFVVDLESGKYDVRIISGSEWDNNTTTYQLEDGEEKGGESTSAGEFITYEDTVEVTDGQLNITFGGEWARINAVEIVHVDDYQRKFDFGNEDSPVKYGHIQVANTSEYSEEIGYGLNKVVDSRDRENPDEVGGDFVIDDDYEFMVDLRNGVYAIKTITGDQIASNTTTFTIEGNSYEAIESAEGEFSEFETYAVVEDGQLNMEISQRINGLEVYYVGELPNKDDLEQLIVDAKEITNEDNDYTEDSFEKLQTAIANAEEVVENEIDQEIIDQVYSTLDSAIDQLEELVSIETEVLEKLISQAKGYSNEDQAFTEESFETLLSSIRSAEDVLNSAETQEAIDQAHQDLSQAITNLEAVKPDESEKYDITDINQTNKSDNVYTVEQESDAFIISTDIADQMEANTFLQLSNGLVKVEIPKAILELGDEVEFYFDEANESIMEQFQDALSPLVGFTLIVDGEELTAFEDTPITLSFELDQEDISDEDMLRMVYINEDLEKTEEFEGEWDDSTDAFSAEVTHFSMYGVFEVDSEIEEETSSDQNDGEGTTTTEDDKGSFLPETATNMFNMLIIGLVLLVSGVVFFYVYRRKSLQS